VYTATSREAELDRPPPSGTLLAITALNPGTGEAETITSTVTSYHAHRAASMEMFICLVVYLLIFLIP